jgi:PAS domain S-box-containing protein
LSYALQLAAGELSVQNFFALIKYIGVVLVSPAFLTFALAYAGKSQWLNFRTLILLSIEPVAVLLLLFTNDFHRLMWTQIRLEEIAGFQARVTSHGLLFWAHTFYAYTLLFAGCYLLIRATLHKGAYFQAQSLAVVIGILAPTLGNVVYLSRLNPFHPFDLTPFFFFISGLAFFYSIFRHRLLDTLPIAHERVIRNMKDGLIVLDPSNHILELNPPVQSLVGESFVNSIGKPIYQAFSDWPDLLRACDSSAESEPVICPAPKGSRFYEVQPTLLRSQKGELLGRLLVLHDITEALLAAKVLKKANEELEKRVQERTSELKRANQRLLEEAEERHRAEKVLRESEELHHRITEQPFDGIYLHREGKIVFINQTGARLLGAESPDHVIGMSVLDFIHPDYREFVSRRIDRIYREGKQVDPAEEKFVRFDGREIDVEVAGAGFHYGGGLSTLVVFRDITERKAAQDQIRRAKEELEGRVQERTAALAQINLSLRKEIAERERVEKELRIAKEEAEAANRAKSTFLANMSHEVRTPLNAIIGFSQLIADGQVGDLNGTQKEYMTDVLQSGQHLLSLINDILDLSKVEAGKMELELEAVSLRALVERSFAMVREKALKHGIETWEELSGIPDPIVADERKLKQVLFNLISNAVKFTPDGGRVGVRGDSISKRNGSWVREDGRSLDGPIPVQFETAEGRPWALVSVEDTGIGIEKGSLERIFAPFEQADGTASRRFQGTGLGLTLTRQFVELHGGKVWAESEGLGKGSAFRFLIPISREKEEDSRS